MYESSHAGCQSSVLTSHHPKCSCHEPVLVTLMTLPIHYTSNAQLTSTVAFFSMNRMAGLHPHTTQHPERTQH